MAKKKKHTNKNKSQGKRKSVPRTSKKKNIEAPKSSSSSNPKKFFTPIQIAGLIFALLFFLFLFGQNWLKDSTLFSTNNNDLTSSEERLPFPDHNLTVAKDDIKFSDYAGSEACAGCHAAEYNLWKKSTHGGAGGDPNSKVVIGNFDGKKRTFKDGTVTPIKNGNTNYAFKLNAKDLPEQTFKVDAVVGGGHMIGGGTQTYFSTFPDGTLRFLPFDYIREEQVWFGETNQSKGWIPITKDLSINELSEFPPSRILGAHLQMDNCQECHGSQIQVSFDSEKKRFDTRYTSLSINCESCHGPGKKHIEIAQSGKIDTASNIGMLALGTLSKDESLEVCFRCHALKDVLEPGYLQGKDLEAHYSLKFPIAGENPFHPDGRIRAFGYQQNHLFSDCYINGSMTCVDCHDPHSQNYRDITGKELADPFDDGQCTGCHGSKAIDPTAHSHHAVDSPGNKCVSCHMPYLQHQAMGKELKFARSDHTIPIPRPAFDTQLGIENACYKCHQDKSIEWLQEKTTEWYGEIKPHKEWITNLMKAQKNKNLKSASTLLLNGSSVEPLGQMMGLSQFVKDYLSPEMKHLEPEVVNQIKSFIDASDIDVKSLAFASLHLAQDHNPVIHNYLVKKLEELDDDDATKVRKRWTTLLPSFAKKYEDNQDYNNAITIYKKALEVLPDNPAVLSNLGYTYQRMGKMEEALRYYQKALDANQNDAMGWVNLGNTQQNMGNTAAAIQSYQKAIDVNPWNAIAHFNLGNHHYRLDELPSAISFYKKAIERDPTLATSYFNLTRAYIKAKEFREALATVKSGLRFEPTNETGQLMLKDLEEAFARVK